MFKSLGKGFVDVFRQPLGLIYGYILMFVFIAVYGLIYEYPSNLSLSSGTSIITSFIYLIKNFFWWVVLYLVFYLFTIYFGSMLIAYITNKKAGSEKKLSGTGKVFGFTLFLTIISVLPSIIFSLFNPSLTLSLIFLLISLFYVFFLYPVLLCVPILLVKNDLKYSLNESFKFAKEHYGWIILLQFLFVIILMILSGFLASVSNYLTDIGSFFIFLIVLVILFLWSIHFIYNWYYEKSEVTLTVKVNEKKK